MFEKDFDIKLPWVQRIVQWIKNLKNILPVDILIGSHGDPFASRLYRELITQLTELDVPVRFQLRTNGLLLCRYLNELNILPKLSQLEISIDAATEQTYEQVRHPGRWSALIENLDYCLQLRTNGKSFQVQANFVIQRANYQEMSAFVDLCRKYRMSPNFTVLQDWSTFSYKDNAVHLPDHSCYQEFAQLINDPNVKQIIGKKLDHWITK
jgi:MoaA/NifB/PqqE/SkfB family radical SAM enzyme